MANTVISLKKSNVPSAIPTNLANGEIAINYADGKLYYKNTAGQIDAISGKDLSYFGTVNAAGTFIISDTPGDILTIVNGNDIEIVGDAVNDTITISANLKPAFDKANSANVLAYNTGIGANSYAVSVGASGNSYTNAVGAAANSWANTKLANTSDISFNGNLYFPTGNVGIGTTSPAYKLDVVGTINCSSLLINGSPLAGGLSIVDQTTSSSTFYPMLADITTGSESAANVSSTKLYFVPSTGTLSATIFNSLSDEKLKEDVKSFDGLELLSGINPVSFVWKDIGKQSYGVIAQELEKTLPELVETTNGIKSVSYTPMIAILIDVVKKQEKRIAKLESLLNMDKQ